MTNQNSVAVQYYSRFSLAQRYLHGVVMATFLGLALTGMVLRFSHAAWAAATARAIGGFAAILFYHKFCAVVLTIAFLAHVGDLAYRAVVKKDLGIFWGPNSMIPQLKDLQDLFAHLKWFLWLGPRPSFDRFAYWEKFDYWGVFWGMAVIGISGYAMWFAPFFARFVPGSWLNIALLIHGEEALLAIWFIFAVHFFNTHLRPGSFPMDLVIFTGRESEKELKERRPAAYKRLVQSGQLQGMQTTAPAAWVRALGTVIGIVAITTGFVLLVLTITSFIRGQ